MPTDQVSILFPARSSMYRTSVAITLGAVAACHPASLGARGIDLAPFPDNCEAQCLDTSCPTGGKSDELVRVEMCTLPGFRSQCQHLGALRDPCSQYTIRSRENRLTGVRTVVLSKAFLYNVSSINPWTQRVPHSSR